MNEVSKFIRPLLPGLILALLTLLYGYGMGVGLGAWEDDIKKSLANSAQQVQTSVYIDDAAKMEKAIGKGFTYLRRAHIHAAGLGTANLVVILVLGLVTYNRRVKLLMGLALGLGGLGYSVTWALAGWQVPVLGGGGPAKASVEWLALPSVALLLLGTLTVLGLCVMGLIKKAK